MDFISRNLFIGGFRNTNDAVWNGCFTAGFLY